MQIIPGSRVNMNSKKAAQIFEKLKKGQTNYNEEVHCKLLIETMTNTLKGTVSAFCTHDDVLICERTFWTWVKNHELFGAIHGLGAMFAREAWEAEGRRICDLELPMGTISYAYEYWKMIGWARFGIGKTQRIRLELNPESTPDQHYKELLQQASTGAFTSGEIKQLMEAINVGLNTHQVFQLQKEIDQLKSDLETMAMNSDGNNSRTNQGIAQKD